MCQMLLSINPEHVDNILSGEKRFEFRKVRCKQDVDKIVIYATAPRKMVVAEVQVEEIIEDDVNTVWRLTRDFAGIPYSFFSTYYEGRSKAVAYKLGVVEIFEEPRTLSEYGVKFPPQSFVYLRGTT